MSRILAIDYGARRTGLAVTDPLQIIANPLDVVPTHELEEYLKNYFSIENVEKVVIGMPKNTNGSDTDATVLVRAFVNRFRKVFIDMRLILHDERFTSRLAFNSMIAGGLKKKNRQNKGTVDKVSATIILQSYLESIS
ncbi:MAG: Holliday junction resolvase RuvX [Ekhidna sp.]|nr:Holliday junction resolvase RuvX [Ekhidna sp.]MBC6409583.1 Holliday junction resolvase RuvX [Ekhidna sp.]MBC6425652.1 Holliday junction resolvase RuvX [Ekhidna sp.]